MIQNMGCDIGATKKIIREDDVIYVPLTTFSFLMKLFNQPYPKTSQMYRTYSSNRQIIHLRYNSQIDLSVHMHQYVPEFCCF